jgi:hypothetical protein
MQARFEAHVITLGIERPLYTGFRMKPREWYAESELTIKRQEVAADE